MSGRKPFKLLIFLLACAKINYATPLIPLNTLLHGSAWKNLRFAFIGTKVQHHREVRGSAHISMKCAFLIGEEMTNDELISLKRKWKKIERISYLTVFVLMVGYSVLSTVSKFTNFNSFAFFVLVVILSVIMVVDATFLFVSWYKLYRINSLIAELDADDEQNIDEEDVNG